MERLTSQGVWMMKKKKHRFYYQQDVYKDLEELKIWATE
jgi:hypothetical protein